MPEPARASVIIAAHNEATLIHACLTTLLSSAAPSEFEVIVAANGCTDDTAQVAGDVPGVRVVELPEAGKANALNAAERYATAYPRVYLDADIKLSTRNLRKLCAALEAGRALAACPSRHIDVSGSSLVVRAHCAISQRLPTFDRGLYGKGVIALSFEGRKRFATFPTITADDLFLDSLFEPAEKIQLPEVTVTVAAPRRARDLLGRLVRVRRGNQELRARTGATQGRLTVAPPKPFSWLFDVVLPRPWLAPAAAVYVVVTAMAEIRARSKPRSDWGQDRSTRY